MHREEINHRRLEEQLNEIAALIGREPAVLDERVPAVSQWSVSQHLDHLTKVMRAVSTMLLKAEEKEGGKMNFLGRAVLLTGFIPRGKGKSPEAVLGRAASAADLIEAVKNCRALLAKVREVIEPPKHPVFPHPFFGHLTRDEALRFLVVHNRHHFKIIRDVLARGLVR